MKKSSASLGDLQIRVLLNDDNAFFVDAFIEGELDIKGPRLVDLLAVTECPDVDDGSARNLGRSVILTYADAFRAVATAAEARAKFLENLAAGTGDRSMAAKAATGGSMEVRGESP